MADVKDFFAGVLHRFRDMGNGTHALALDTAVKTLSHESGTKSSSGDNELMAAPGEGFRIVVTAFVIQNESAVATTMILKDGSKDVWRALGQNQGDGLAKASPWKLTENAALNLNLDGANSCGYSVAYYTETV